MCVMCFTMCVYIICLHLDNNMWSKHLFARGKLKFFIVSISMEIAIT